MKPKFIVLIIGATTLLGTSVLWLANNQGCAKQPLSRAKELVSVTAGSDHTSRLKGARNNALDASGQLKLKRELLNSGKSASPKLLAITNRGGGRSYVARAEAVRNLGSTLDDHEIQYLYAFLMDRGPTDEPGRMYDHNIKNEVMDYCCRSGTLGIMGLLMNVYGDVGQDVVIRDYAIQHLGQWYDRADADDKRQIRNTLLTALQETGSSVAGTSLLALLRLSAGDSAFNREEVADVALRIARDDRCSELSRITAIQVCARMHMDQAAPIARNLAETGETIAMRVAAIAAIGDVGDGDENTTAFLNRLTNSPDSLLKTAAESALRRLSKRMVRSG